MNNCISTSSSGPTSTLRLVLKTSVQETKPIKSQLFNISNFSNLDITHKENITHKGRIQTACL